MGVGASPWVGCHGIAEVLSSVSLFKKGWESLHYTNRAAPSPNLTHNVTKVKCLPKVAVNVLYSPTAFFGILKTWPVRYISRIVQFLCHYLFLRKLISSIWVSCKLQAIFDRYKLKWRSTDNFLLWTTLLNFIQMCSVVSDICVIF
jgi:hypothetical protein